jgi:opacity protein-like surface antigen
MKSLHITIALLFVSLLPRGAAAQAFVNPFIDTTLSSPSATGGSSKPGVGISFGNLGTIVGHETEVTYHPQIVDNTANALAKSHAFTFSENLLIGPTIGRVKPYGAIGGGDLFLNVTSIASVAVPSPESISNNYFTLNFGGGVAYFLNKNVGVRGDLRYFRAYGLNISDLEASGLTFNRFDFWRAGVGVAFKF